MSKQHTVPETRTPYASPIHVTVIYSLFAHVMAVYAVIDCRTGMSLSTWLPVWQEAILACKFPGLCKAIRAPAPFLRDCKIRKYPEFPRVLRKRNCPADDDDVEDVCARLCLCAVGCVTILNCLWQIISSAKRRVLLTYSRNCSPHSRSADGK